MRYKTTKLSGWNNYPQQSCKILRPERSHDLLSHNDIIARGQGRSYGDAALNGLGYVCLTERLNRFLAFDATLGILKAEAGVTLAEILSVIVPAGWFLPVLPGTKFVSLGGCVAADVHGKNHYRAGSFSQHIIELELKTANRQSLRCSPTENVAQYWSTVGGMGLTGIIATVTLKLVPITSAYLQADYAALPNLAATLAYFAEQQANSEYLVAWIDGLVSAKQLGRSIAMRYRHLAANELPSSLQAQPLHLKPSKKLSIPFNLPSPILNRPLIKAFNHFYYKQQAKKAPFISDFHSAFFPLDRIAHWNRLYGRPGFIQYQCVFPSTQALSGIQTVLEKINQAKCTAFLGVLKSFGAGSQGLLSFPMPGFALALDLPIHNERLFGLLNELDETVIKFGGRVYLAKDARLSAANFRRMYTAYPTWLAQKKLMDPHFCFNSTLSRRLQIGSEE